MVQPADCESAKQKSMGPLAFRSQPLAGNEHNAHFFVDGANFGWVTAPGATCLLVAACYGIIGYQGARRHMSSFCEAQALLRGTHLSHCVIRFGLHLWLTMGIMNLGSMILMILMVLGRNIMPAHP
jgi:hypothetical protein